MDMTDIQEFQRKTISDRKQYLINLIKIEIKYLHDEDTEGHVWWNRFKDYVEKWM